MGRTPTDIGTVQFSKPPFGKRGYDGDQVDEFLRTCTDALARCIGGDRSAPLPDVKRVAFDIRRRGARSYSQVEVDAFLDVLDAELSRFRVLPTDAPAQVDAFVTNVQHAMARLANGDLTAAVPDVRHPAFAPNTGANAYDAAQVDAFVDLLAKELPELQAAARADVRQRSAAAQPMAPQAITEPEIAKPLYDNEKPRWKFWH